jgi:hypothetical protein
MKTFINFIFIVLPFIFLLQNYAFLHSVHISHRLSEAGHWLGLHSTAAE